jgi:CheY-like chemotaxis protein
MEEESGQTALAEVRVPRFGLPCPSSVNERRQAMIAHILIVEDDRELQELYATFLGSIDWQIERAYDGQEALEKLKERAPDLVILDILLDEMMGDTLFVKMKESPLYQDTPIIVASVLSLERCQHLIDMDPRTIFLRKPFRREDLVRAVKEGLARVSLKE